jgi:hypothetical protein
VRDARRVFGRPLFEGRNAQLVFGGMLAVALGLASAGLVVAACHLPALEAVLAAVCAALLLLMTILLARLWLQTFRSEARRL